MNKIKNIIKRVIVCTLTLSLMIPFSTYAADPEEVTVEGIGNYFVTGESYPTDITFSGYNSRDTLLYTNIAFETTKTVDAGKVATFSYYVEVYDTNGALIGGVGNATTPETVAGAAGATTASVANKLLTLTSALTAQYKVVVIVTSVAIV